MQRIIVIQGPTASGKTALAVQLAKHFQTVVISADSRQFYKETSIGTAKPTLEEMEGVPHYFVDSHSILSPLTAGNFEEEALHIIESKLKDKENIILVGGSGMFIDALCNGLDNIPTDPNLQLELRKELAENGIEPLLTELEEKDPIYYNQVDKHNSHRILRAIEVIRLTGLPFSAQRSNAKQERSFESVYFHIDHKRETLYDRINRRVDIMMENGLLEEVKSLAPHKELMALQTVGYKELFDFLNDNYTLAEAVDKIKQHTRNYAKRQITWINRKTESVALDPYSKESMLNQVIGQLDNEGNSNLE